MWGFPGTTVTVPDRYHIYRTSLLHYDPNLVRTMLERQAKHGLLINMPKSKFGDPKFDTWPINDM